MIRLEYKFSEMDLSNMCFVNVSRFEDDDFSSMEHVARYELERVGEFDRDNNQLKLELVVVRLSGPVEFGMYILLWDLATGRDYISRRCEYEDGWLRFPIPMATHDVEVLVYDR